jgi:EmrB/QacA subfamily drug resistance transporter
MNIQPESIPTNKNIVLIITTIASFFMTFMASAINIALPRIGTEFDMDVITLGWISTAYMLASAALLVPFGRIADMKGRRKIFILGNIIFFLGSILSAISLSGVMLLIARAIQGIGGSAIFATSVAILTSAFPIEERGKVLGINTASVYLGLSLGPVLGGLLTQYTGWKSIFLISSITTIIVIIGAFWRLREEAVETRADQFDLKGSVIYMLALVLTMYGVSQLPDMSAFWFIGSGFVATVLFFWWEKRTQYPLINMGMFRNNRGYTFSNLAALVNYSGTWAIAFVLSLYLQYIKGFDPRTAGIILITSPTVQAIFSPIFGRLSDRVEPRILASVGMAVTALGIGLLSFISQNTAIAYIITSLIIVGFGFALFSAPNTNAIMSSADRQFYGVASATLATMRQLGMMVSMGIVWVVFAIVIGRVEITPEYHEAFIRSSRIIFLISALLCASAISFSLIRGKIHPNIDRTSARDSSN